MMMEADNKDMPVMKNQNCHFTFNVLFHLHYATRFPTNMSGCYLQSVVFVFNKTCCITFEAACKLDRRQ